MKITKQYLKQVIKEELERVQNEGLMDFFSGNPMKKEWAALVNKLWPRISNNDLQPQEVAEVLRYTFDPSAVRAAGANPKKFADLSPKSRLTSANSTIKNMSPHLLNRILDRLDITNNIFNLTKAAAQNPSLGRDITNSEGELEISDRDFEASQERKREMDRFQRDSDNRVAAYNYDKQQAAYAKEKEKRDERDRARREREEEEARSTKNSPRSGF